MIQYFSNFIDEDYFPLNYWAVVKEVLRENDQDIVYVLWLGFPIPVNVWEFKIELVMAKEIGTMLTNDIFFPVTVSDIVGVGVIGINRHVGLVPRIVRGA